MGRDKAWLDTGDGPLGAIIATLVARSCGLVTLVGDPVKYAELGYPVIPDRVDGLGPLGGIETALGASTAEWNLVVACDMPSLDAAIFDSLFAEAAGFDCAVPRHADGKLEPLCAVYNKRCHAAIAAALNSGIRKVTDGLQMLALRYVQTGNEGAFANLNTPADLRKHQNA
jgi:molybdopterin-guanine dinucleotide biosynthesis protein A